MLFRSLKIDTSLPLSFGLFIESVALRNPLFIAARKYIFLQICHFCFVIFLRAKSTTVIKIDDTPRRRLDVHRVEEHIPFIILKTRTQCSKSRTCPWELSLRGEGRRDNQPTATKRSSNLGNVWRCLSTFPLKFILTTKTVKRNLEAAD